MSGLETVIIKVNPWVFFRFISQDMLSINVIMIHNDSV